MKILIIGGGMGGTILANHLARRLPEEMLSGKVKVTMLSASERHMYQPGLLYIAVGRLNSTAIKKVCSNPGLNFSSILPRNSNWTRIRL